MKKEIQGTQLPIHTYTNKCVHMYCAAEPSFIRDNSSSDNKRSQAEDMKGLVTFKARLHICGYNVNTCVHTHTRTN